ncbi:agmatine deiminase family protein [Maribacter sp. 2307ULW6-5]|uniref:agmatine deiminase family protein n=1 Tax=Maribacter sp. 2307ULW6-5 TaxID=3386275 RepID=UPI0039BD5395
MKQTSGNGALENRQTASLTDSLMWVHSVLKDMCMPLLMLLFLGACKETVPKTNGQSLEPVVLRQPAEYEEQSAVWLIWPPDDHLRKYSNEEVTLQVIEALAGRERLMITAANDSLLQRAKAKVPREYLERGWVQLMNIPSQEFWVRDMGPNFVQLVNGQKAIVDFGFNAWGYTDTQAMDDYTILMEKYDEALAQHLGLPLLQTEMISEGGNREVNGKGVLLVAKTVEQGRNPNMTLNQMEKEFKRLLGVEKTIWLEDGLVEDDHTFKGPKRLENGTMAYTAVTTNGHIDEFARFVNDSTILLAYVKPEDRIDAIGKENHRRLEENYHILKKATDHNGNPFNIVRMPLPELIIEEMAPGDTVYDYISTLSFENGWEFPRGDTIQVMAAASYLNFLITDEVVLGQKYHREGMDVSFAVRDGEAEEVLQQVFPDREILMINALSVNFGGGGLHCITMQEPLLNPLKPKK